MSESEELIRKNDKITEEIDESHFQAQNKQSEPSIKEIASSENDDGDELEKSKNLLLQAEYKVLLQQDADAKELVNDEENMCIQADIFPCHSCEILDPISATKVTCCCGLCTRSLLPKDGIKKIWIISIPIEDNPQKEFDKLKRATQDKEYSINYKFHIPNLTTGRFDSLITIMDELMDFDLRTEDLLRRLAHFMITSAGDDFQPNELFLANNMDLLTYLTRFTWNSDKYPLQNSLTDIFDALCETIKKISVDLKSRSEEYSNINSTLKKIKKDIMGNLLTRPLTNLVKKEDLLLDSEYFTSLLVVVPKTELKKWWETYETLIDMVVPQSSKELFSDESHSLVTVIVAKKFIDDFEITAKENKFTVRTFQFSDKEAPEDNEIIAKLKKIRDDINAVSLRWLKVNFSECFISWIHMKALKVFIESVVRYGIPINFQAILLIPLKNNKLKQVLGTLYKNVDSNLGTLSIHDIPQDLYSYGVNKYLPYIFLTVRINFHDGKKI